MEAPSCELTNATIEKHLQRLELLQVLFLCWNLNPEDDTVLVDKKVCRQSF